MNDCDYIIKLPNYVGVSIMKKTLLISGAVIAGVAIIVAALLLVPNMLNKDYLLIGDGDLYFGMSKGSLTSELGEPEETTKDVGDTLMTEYVFDQKIGDHDAKGVYLISKSGLTQATITVENIDYDSAVFLTKEIIDKQKSLYSKDEGYYCTSFETNEGMSFEVSNGTNDGATGISFTYEFLGDSLTINAVRQK